MAMESPAVLPATHQHLNDEEQEFQAQLQAWNLTFAFASSMAVKAACTLRIPDILAIEGRPLTLHEISSRLSSATPDLDYLYRVLRFLCLKGVFSLETVPTSDGRAEPRYGITPISKWLVQGKTGLSLAPLALMEMSPEALTPWLHMSDCVLHGGTAFERAHGMPMWSFANQKPDFNTLFNDAMANCSGILMRSILELYHGFENVETLVDVGGGIGWTISQIKERYPSIKAINFDLPHVVATAPSFAGVEHIGGDMFKSVPSADAILMKWIMHNWDDENCIKILNNCGKALPETGGKLIIVDAVLPTDREQMSALDELRVVSDLVMIAHCSGGKERTIKQWENLLPKAGFPRFNIIPLPSIYSVIEAFPVSVA